MFHPRRPWTTCSSPAFGRPCSRPEGEVARWFSWPVPDGTLERLVAEGRIVRYSSISPALVGTKPHASK